MRGGGAGAVVPVILIVVGGLLLYSGFTGRDPRRILAETFAPATVTGKKK